MSNYCCYCNLFVAPFAPDRINVPGGVAHKDCRTRYYRVTPHQEPRR